MNNPMCAHTQTALVSSINFLHKGNDHDWHTVYRQFVSQTVIRSKLDIETFQAGRIKHYYNNWCKLTSDPEILNIVKGCRLDFQSVPTQATVPRGLSFSPEESLLIDTEIARLLKAGVLIKCAREKGDFLSPIFLRSKRDGGHRIILNLKKLNTHLVYHHFKMDTLRSVISMMRPGCYMCSLDVKDAYYSVPVANSDRKYLKFQWKNAYYQYTAFANGLSQCPRKYTKLLKPVFAFLRKQALISLGYLDDAYLQGSDMRDCAFNVYSTVTLFQSLGFVIHPEKSEFIPSQELTFLGFVLNSVLMRVSLTPDKASSIKHACQKLLVDKQPTIRTVSRVIGLLVASFPGVMYGPLFYRHLEFDKTHALKLNLGNFDAVLTLSHESLAELRWWEQNVTESYCPILQGDPDIIIESDSSLKGWGGYVKSCNTAIGGEWTPGDLDAMHINALELKAAFLALQSFCKHEQDKHVRLVMDNVTAVSYIRRMGGSKSKQCNDIAKQIWLFAMKHNLWLSSSYIKGSENTVADYNSRNFERELEWKLHPAVFHKVLTHFTITCDIDLFASRINYQLEQYVSYKPDPGAYAVDAFTLCWTKYTFYAFPPFSVIQNVLQKVSEDQATGIIIVPFWPTQTFFPALMHMLISYPLFIGRKVNLLTLPSQPQLKHPLHHKLNLLACYVSGNVCKQQEFLHQLKTSSCTPGDQHHRSNTLVTSINGHNFAVHGIPLPLMRL